jgi:primosomal replication protein N
MSEDRSENTVRITGKLLEKDALRLTPARVPIVGFRIEHASRLVEAGIEREVSCEIEVRAIGPVAHRINAVPLGSQMAIEGFLAAKSVRSRYPVLHVRTFELLEGMNHGL